MLGMVCSSKLLNLQYWTSRFELERTAMLVCSVYKVS